MSSVELWTGGWEVNRAASERGLKVGPGVLFFPLGTWRQAPSTSSHPVLAVGLGARGLITLCRRRYTTQCLEGLGPQRGLCSSRQLAPLLIKLMHEHRNT